MKLQLDWMHVVLICVGAGCMTACILLGKGNVLLQILSAMGGTSGVALMLKYSPLYGPPAKVDVPNDTRSKD